MPTGGRRRSTTLTRSAIFSSLRRSRPPASRGRPESGRPYRRRGSHRQSQAAGRRRHDPRLNPDEQCDRDLAVIRVDDEVGGAICTVVAFASHPVVVGPDCPRCHPISSARCASGCGRGRAGRSSFPGVCGEHRPLRVVPHRKGPERAFGDRLALGALTSREAAGLEPTRREQMAYASAIPIAVWRNVATGEPQDLTLAALERRIDLPLLDPPTLEEIRALRAELEQRVADLRAAGEPADGLEPGRSPRPLGRGNRASESRTEPSNSRSRCRSRRFGSAAPASPRGRASRSASSDSR